MINSSVKVALSIFAGMLLASQVSYADAAKKVVKKSPQRKMASANFSGTRVGSSNLYEIGTVSDADMKVDVARAESVVVVKKLDQGRVALVTIDGGGSSDIGAAMASSSLYLVFFQDGEWHNKKAAFLLGGVNSFRLKSLNNTVATVELNCKNERLAPINTDTVINFDKFLKIFLDYQQAPKKGPDGVEEGDMDDWLPQGKITSTKKCLPDFE